MKDLQKKQSLCEELNMNFDEVNELFAEETLQSMQMAKIVPASFQNRRPVLYFYLCV